MVRFATLTRRCVALSVKAPMVDFAMMVGSTNVLGRLTTNPVHTGDVENALSQLAGVGFARSEEFRTLTNDNLRTCRALLRAIDRSPSIAERAPPEDVSRFVAATVALMLGEKCTVTVFLDCFAVMCQCREIGRHVSRDTTSRLHARTVALVTAALPSTSGESGDEPVGGIPQPQVLRGTRESWASRSLSNVMDKRACSHLWAVLLAARRMRTRANALAAVAHPLLHVVGGLEKFHYLPTLLSLSTDKAADKIFAAAFIEDADKLFASSPSPLDPKTVIKHSVLMSTLLEKMTRARTREIDVELLSSSSMPRAWATFVSLPRIPLERVTQLLVLVSLLPSWRRDKTLAAVCLRRVLPDVVRRYQKQSDPSDQLAASAIERVGGEAGINDSDSNEAVKLADAATAEASLLAAKEETATTTDDRHWGSFVGHHCTLDGDLACIRLSIDQDLRKELVTSNEQVVVALLRAIPLLFKRRDETVGSATVTARTADSQDDGGTGGGGSPSFPPLAFGRGLESSSVGWALRYMVCVRRYATSPRDRTGMAPAGKLPQFASLFAEALHAVSLRLPDMAQVSPDAVSMLKKAAGCFLELTRERATFTTVPATDRRMLFGGSYGIAVFGAEVTQRFAVNLATGVLACVAKTPSESRAFNMTEMLCETLRVALVGLAAQSSAATPSSASSSTPSPPGGDDSVESLAAQTKACAHRVAEAVTSCREWNLGCFCAAFVDLIGLNVDTRPLLTNVAPCLMKHIVALRDVMVKLRRLSRESPPSSDLTREIEDLVGHVNNRFLTDMALVINALLPTLRRPWCLSACKSLVLYVTLLFGLKNRLASLWPSFEASFSTPLRLFGVANLALVLVEFQCVMRSDESSAVNAGGRATGHDGGQPLVAFLQNALASSSDLPLEDVRILASRLSLSHANQYRRVLQPKQRRDGSMRRVSKGVAQWHIQRVDARFVPSLRALTMAVIKHHERFEQNRREEESQAQAAPARGGSEEETPIGLAQGGKEGDIVFDAPVLRSLEGDSAPPAAPTVERSAASPLPSRRRPGTTDVVIALECRRLLAIATDFGGSSQAELEVLRQLLHVDAAVAGCADRAGQERSVPALSSRRCLRLSDVLPSLTDAAQVRAFSLLEEGSAAMDCFDVLTLLANSGRGIRC